MDSRKPTCIYDMYGCKSGTTICLKVNTDSDSLKWTFNGESIKTHSDKRKCFEKENASCSDTGKYRCTVENVVRYVFDVVVYDNYDTYECSVDSTINLTVNTDSTLATWTLNGKHVMSECYPQIAFKKELAKFADSGRYECTVGENVIHAFDVIVYEYELCHIGLMLQLNVKTESSCTAWSLNGDHVKSENPYDKGFQKYIKSIKDLGRYVCKVDGKVKYAYHVIELSHIRCKIGSTINLKVYEKNHIPAWTFDGKEVTSECKEQTVLIKHNADFSDSGTYEFKHKGITRCAFDVTVYDDYEFDIGSTIYFDAISHSHCPTWYFRGQSVNSECDPGKGFEKKNAVHADAGRYEGKVNGIVKYTFNVIIHDYIEIKIGSTLHMMEETSNVPQWTLNGKYVSTECAAEKGFEKKNADYRDSGRYEYKMMGALENIFDVIVYGSFEKHECRFGSTIYLEVKTDYICPTWTFNGENVSSECCPHKGFEKKNADFSDTGKYICKVDDKVTHIFDVVIYEFLFGNEFLGIRIMVPDGGSGTKPGILSKSEEGNAEDKTETNTENNTSAELKPEQTSQHKAPSDDMEEEETNTEESPSAEVKGYKPEQTSQHRSPLSDTKEKETNTEESPSTEVKGYKPEQTSQHRSPLSDTNEKETNTEESPSAEVKGYKPEQTSQHRSPLSDTKEKAPEKQSRKLEYGMEGDPTGLAVIIAIGKFESNTLSEFPGMKETDTGRFKETFEKLKFNVRDDCPGTKSSEIIKYLKEIAKQDHKKYDCFVLLFSTHGANGFVYCSDFTGIKKQTDEKNMTEIEKGINNGVIFFSTLIDMFVSKDCPLFGKPKLFFFDSCRTMTNEDFAQKCQSAIRVLNDQQTLTERYSDISIGYGAVVGASARIDKQDNNGSRYTKELTTCLFEKADKDSFADMMTEVAGRMKRNHKIVVHQETTLCGKIKFNPKTLKEQTEDEKRKN